MDPQLKSQLRETIYVATSASVDAAGDSSFNAPAARLARVVNKQLTFEKSDGTVEKSDVAIITVDVIAMDSRVWLPGDNSANATLARIPRFVERAVTEFGQLDFFRTYL
jgi:hypothetical protein